MIIDLDVGFLFFFDRLPLDNQNRKLMVVLDCAHSLVVYPKPRKFLIRFLFSPN